MRCVPESAPPLEISKKNFFITQTLFVGDLAKKITWASKFHVWHKKSRFMHDRGGCISDYLKGPWAEKYESNIYGVTYRF